MSKLPSLRSQQVLTILFAHGFEKVRISGSHIRLRKGAVNITVPHHAGKTIPRGTLRSIIRQSEMTVEKFLSKR